MGLNFNGYKFILLHVILKFLYKSNQTLSISMRFVSSIEQRTALNVYKRLKSLCAEQKRTGNFHYPVRLLFIR